jgi:hypothetical protein
VYSPPLKKKRYLSQHRPAPPWLRLSKWAPFFPVLATAVQKNLIAGPLFVFSSRPKEPIKPTGGARSAVYPAVYFFCYSIFPAVPHVRASEFEPGWGKGSAW